MLSEYSVVITGSHPEYWSERALDALEDYVAEGGRLMYMGGNGFYWVVSSTEEEPYVMEVRKGEAGMRAWQATRASCTTRPRAERGGLWRLRGRPPQKLTGVGFTTEGFDFCRPYRRMPDSFHKTARVDLRRHRRRGGDRRLRARARRRRRAWRPSATTSTSARPRTRCCSPPRTGSPTTTPASTRTSSSTTTA